MHEKILRLDPAPSRTSPRERSNKLPKIQRPFLSLRVGGKDLDGILGILRVGAHRAPSLFYQLPSSLLSRFSGLLVRLAVRRGFRLVDGRDATFRRAAILRPGDHWLLLWHGLKNAKAQRDFSKNESVTGLILQGLQSWRLLTLLDLSLWQIGDGSLTSKDSWYRYRLVNNH